MALMQLSRQAKRALWGLPLGAALGAAVGRLVESAESFVLLSTGGFAPGAAGFSLEAMLYALPVLLQLLLFGGEVRSDLESAWVYLFTRTKKRSHWLWAKVGAVLYGGLLYWLLVLAGGLAVCLLYGLPAIGLPTLGAAVAAQLCTVGAYSTLLALFVNVLSLRLEFPAALAAGIVLWLAGQFVLNDLLVQSGVGAFLFPTTQGMVAAHDLPSLRALEPAYFAGHLPGFTPLVSLAVTALYTLLCALWGLRLLRRTGL